MRPFYTQRAQRSSRGHGLLHPRTSSNPQRVPAPTGIRLVGGWLPRRGPVFDLTCLAALAQPCHSLRGLLGTTKCWPCESNPVCLGSYVSHTIGGASGDCGLSAGVLAAGPVGSP